MRVSVTRFLRSGIGRLLRAGLLPGAEIRATIVALLRQHHGAAPDEIPAAAWPPKEEPWPLLYPMHCHIEMSQTACGGQYPQGMVTHWELLGPSRGVAV